MRTVRSSGFLPLGAAALLLAAAVACGSGGGKSSSEPQPPAGGTAGGGSGGGGSGGGSTGGGSSPGDGNVPPGGGGSGGSAGGSAGGGGDNGSGSGSSAPGDGNGGGAGTGSGGSSGATGGGSSGGDASGGSSCSGLAPAFGAAVDVKLDTGTHRVCTLATSTPSGQLALGIEGSFAGVVGVGFVLYAANGQDQGALDGVFQPVRYGLSDDGDLDAWFHWTSRGYQGIVHPGRVGPLSLATFDGSGQAIATSTAVVTASAPDGTGGTLALARDVTGTGQLATTQLQWIDASGSVTRSVQLERDPSIVLSNWGTGHVVVIVTGDAASARWFDAAGAPLTRWFDVGKVSGGSVHLLVDGSVVVSSAGEWRLALADGVAAASAPPSWLATRPGTRLATVRGGRGYAVLGADATRFEVVAASGESCGTFAIPAAVIAPGDTRTPTRLDVGQDGTLVETSAMTLASNVFGIHGAFRWWSGLLR